MNAATRITAPVLLLVLVAIPLLQQPSISPAAISLAGEQAAQTTANPPVAEAHFHHLHLNATDPKAAIDFYTSKFDCEKARFANLMDGVWAQKSWLLFSKVDQPPKADLTSAVWHFGWGAENMKEVYEKQLAMGTKFFTPITDISDIGGNTGATGTFFYAYVLGPDRALIELNTASHHHFGHLHLFSADPVGAGEWYAKNFGARSRSTRAPSREPRMYRGVQIGPSSSLMMDNVNIIIYPVEYTKKSYADQWNGKTELESTRGHVVDHISFSVENLAASLEKLRASGVIGTTEIRRAAGLEVAFIEGPDKMRIELIQGHAHKD
jgi:catechol 2,3-dioxygenase-like lactoylglutathione lyase family enzyme